MSIVDLCPSNACVQATLGIGSVNFRTGDFGGAFFNWSYCVLSVLSDTLVLRCMMFIFCVKDTDLGTMGTMGSIFCPLVFRIEQVVFLHVSCTV